MDINGDRLALYVIRNFNYEQSIFEVRAGKWDEFVPANLRINRCCLASLTVANGMLALRPGACAPRYLAMSRLEALVHKRKPTAEQ